MLSNIRIYSTYLAVILYSSTSISQFPSLTFPASRNHYPTLYLFFLFSFVYKPEELCAHWKRNRKGENTPQLYMATLKFFLLHSPSCQDSKHTCIHIQHICQAITAGFQIVISHVGSGSFNH